MGFNPFNDQPGFVVDENFYMGAHIPELRPFPRDTCRRKINMSLNGVAKFDPGQTEEDEKDIDFFKPDKTPIKDRLYFLSLKVLYAVLLPLMIIKNLLLMPFKR